RALRRPLRDEADRHDGPVRHPEPHGLARSRGADLRGRQPAAADPGLRERVEEPGDRDREGAALARFVGAVAALAALAQTADPLVADGHRLAPPAWRARR